MRLHPLCIFFFFNDTATTEIYTLSLHDALPISSRMSTSVNHFMGLNSQAMAGGSFAAARAMRSEEHTSELQSRLHLVCRLLLEKKKKVAPCIPVDVSHGDTTRAYCKSCARYASG